LQGSAEIELIGFISAYYVVHHWMHWKENY